MSFFCFGVPPAEPLARLVRLRSVKLTMKILFSIGYWWATTGRTMHGLCARSRCVAPRWDAPWAR
jgi:hypothetical protein